MKLLKIASKPPITVSPDDSISHAVEKFTNHSIGAVAVVENDQLVGIFTERDLVNRVVHRKLSVENTTVREVMTPNPRVAPVEMDMHEALAFMTKDHFRHLPIIDDGGKIQGMLSIRDVMERVVEYLSREVDSMSAYFGADGIGG